MEVVTTSPKSLAPLGAITSCQARKTKTPFIWWEAPKTKRGAFNNNYLFDSALRKRQH